MLATPETSTGSLRVAQTVPLIAVVRPDLLLAASILAPPPPTEPRYSPTTSSCTSSRVTTPPGRRPCWSRRRCRPRATSAARHERPRTGLPFSSARSFNRRSLSLDMIEQATSIYRREDATALGYESEGCRKSALSPEVAPAPIYIAIICRQLDKLISLG
jgi:hypothetical protein